MEPQPLTADQIRAQMRSIRRDLRANVNGMVQNASQIFDWKSYVRSFPWSSVAIAGILGYLIVPRQMKVIAYDKATLENFLREHQLVVAPPPEKPANIVWGTLLPVLGGVALRLGTSYVARVGMDLLAAMRQPSAEQATPQVRASVSRKTPPLRR